MVKKFQEKRKTVNRSLSNLNSNPPSWPTVHHTKSMKEYLTKEILKSQSEEEEKNSKANYRNKLKDYGALVSTTFKPKISSTKKTEIDTFKVMYPNDRFLTSRSSSLDKKVLSLNVNSWLSQI